MSMNRRVTLAMLGLAPTAAIGAESFVDGPVDAIYTGTSTYNERVWANAFRNLAEQIEKGTISVHKLDIAASLQSQEFCQHTLKLEFSYLPDRKVEI